MKSIYDFSLRTFSRLAGYSKSSHHKLEKLVDGRENLFEKLMAFRATFEKPVAWFHVASLGEYEQAKPVIATLKKDLPDYGVVVSFFSPSGYDVANRKPQENVDFITYLPFDTPANAKKFIQILRPNLGFFVKYDLWANHILEAKKLRIPLFLFSASLREDQIYFKSYGHFFREILFSFDHIFCQNRESKNLLEKIGYSKASITGDTRFDRVSSIAASPQKFPEFEDFIKGRKIIVVGSAWQEDMDILIPFIMKDYTYKWIIAPHDIHGEEIQKWKEQCQKPASIYSKGIQKDSELLFIDNVGMLSSLYQFARIAYIGGALGKGLHNILEPLAFKIPVVFGKLKKPSKFPEAEDSIRKGCGFSVNNVKQFHELMDNLAEEKNYLHACHSASKLLAVNVGVSSKIMDRVIQTIKQS